MASEITGLGSKVDLRRGVFLNKLSPPKKKPKHPPRLKPQTYQHFILDVAGKKDYFPCSVPGSFTHFVVVVFTIHQVIGLLAYCLLVIEPKKTTLGSSRAFMGQLILL